MSAAVKTSKGAQLIACFPAAGIKTIACTSSARLARVSEIAAYHVARLVDTAGPAVPAGEEVRRIPPVGLPAPVGPVGAPSCLVERFTLGMGPVGALGPVGDDCPGDT